MASGRSPNPPPAPATTPGRDTASGFEHVRTISEALRYRAQHTPDKAAFIFRDPNDDPNNRAAGRHVLTYSDLYQLAGRWARRGLHSRGIGRGHFVVCLLPNSPERAVVDSAILLSGATCVNGICELKDASDLKSLLKRSRAVALVLDPDFMPDVYAAMLRDVTQTPKAEDGDRVTCESLPDLQFLLTIRRREKGSPEDFLSALRQEAGATTTTTTTTTTEVFHEDVQEGDPCMVFTTSGSSGSPKLVVFTHRPLVTLVRSLQRPADSVEFSVSLMGWVSGYFGNIILSGTTRVLLDARAGLPEDYPLFIFRSVKEEGVTSGSVPLHLLQGLAQKVKDLNDGEPIFAIMGLGAQPITRQIVREASKVARVMVAGYASTEMMFIAAVFGVNPETYRDYFVGSPIPGIEVKVCDDQGREVKADTRGEILVKSRHIFREYLHDPEATSAAFTQDGFFRTGDVGWLDPEGKLYAEGRSHDAIMRGRVVVYPAALESRLRKCPAVRDVMVVGVPDAMTSNELCVCVVLEPGEWTVEHVRRYVEESSREGYTDYLTMSPQYYLAFDTLPLTSTGKPHRKELKKMAEQRILGHQTSPSE